MMHRKTHSLTELCDQVRSVLAPALKQLQGTRVVRGEVVEVLSGSTGTKVTLADRSVSPPNQPGPIPWIEVWLRQDQAKPKVGRILRVEGHLSPRFQDGGGKFRLLLNDARVLNRRFPKSPYRRAQDIEFKAIAKPAQPEITWPIKRMAVLCGTGVGWNDFAQPLLKLGIQVERRPIKLYSASAMAEEIRKAASESFDLISLVRGGANVVDLLPFDEPVLAKAIAESPVPVLLGVGHRKDRVRAERFATVAVATPSAASSYVKSRAKEAERQVDAAQTALRTSVLEDTVRTQRDELGRCNAAAREAVRQSQVYESTISDLSTRLSRERRARRLVTWLGAPAAIAVIGLSVAAGWSIRPLLSATPDPSHTMRATPPPAPTQAKPSRQVARKHRATPPVQPPPAPADAQDLPVEQQP